MMTYYMLLEKLFNLMMFQARTSAQLIDVLELEQAVGTGTAFWNADLQSQAMQGGGFVQADVDEDEDLAERILN